MRTLRQPGSSRGGRRIVVAGLAAATVLFVPGVASAATGTFPPGSTPSPAACQAAIAADVVRLFADFSALPGTPPTSLTQLLTTLQSTLPANATPADFIAALRALAAIGSGTPALPLAGLAGAGATTTKPDSATTGPGSTTTGAQGGTQAQALTGGPNAVPNAATPADALTPPAAFAKIADDLGTLALDLQACAPAAPGNTTPGGNTGGDTSGSTATGATTTGTDFGQQPTGTQTAVPESAQPVSYPGYAATGALAPAGSERTDSAPLAALAGGVLVASAAATAAVRSRARRTGR